jgi:hypothetical protein
VHDDIRRPRRDRLQHGVAVADIQVRVRAREHLVALERVDEIMAELTAGSGDECPHRATTVRDPGRTPFPPVRGRPGNLSR